MKIIKINIHSITCFVIHTLQFTSADLYHILKLLLKPNFKFSSKTFLHLLVGQFLNLIIAFCGGNLLLLLVLLLLLYHLNDC